MGENGEGKSQKSYFDVLGLCCPSEVPLVEKILEPMEGIHKVSVIVPSKTVIVVHDSHLVSQSQIVKALNQARLEASVRAYGTEKMIGKWPNRYILSCGLLLLVSMFKLLFHPLRWVALAAVAVGLPPIMLRSLAAVRRCTLDINILMLIAVSGAVALGDYSEAGFIVFLFITAEWLETRASNKATAGMTSLMSMAPQKAVLAETGQAVDARDVKINTLIAVKAGEVVPIDGVVVDGRSEVDERSLTGESFPVAKQPQSQVWAGTLNIDGYITVKTTAIADNSAVAKMARLVEEAQNSRSETQRLIDCCAKYYTPAVVVVATAVAIIPLIRRSHNPKHSFQLALVLLVSACPCALVLSTPVATFCALLRAARSGLLIKGADVLEELARVRVVAFDKTGTITRGEFSVTRFSATGSEFSLHTLLYWVSSIESKSSHPMASALVDYARSNSIEPGPENVADFHIFPGEGIYGQIDAKDIYIGNQRIIKRASCKIATDVKEMEGGVTSGYVICGTEVIAVFTLSDACRTGSDEAIKELKSLGIKSIMLTGDSATAAMHAQNQLGHVMEELHSELLPEDKVRIIGDVKTKEGPILMVGDGMNDAPALAMANVGISMGISGSAVAMETSHVTLMSNDVRKIPMAIRLARQTRRNIFVNIFFSISTKLGILGLAFAGHPLLWAAVLADVGTCLLVILNSMLLLREATNKKAEKKKCCTGSPSHRSHAERPAVSTGHCAGGSCTSGSTCMKSDHGARRADHRDEHPCMDKKVAEVGERTDCCAGSVPDHNSHSHEEQFISNNASLEDQSRGDHTIHKEHEETHTACTHKKVCSGTDTMICRTHEQKERCCKDDHSPCRRESSESCGRKERYSSSSREITGKSEIAGCCRRYVKECELIDGCCRGSLLKLPEIVTE